MKRTGDNVLHRVLKARYVFPVAGKPIPDGIVTTAGQRIIAVQDGPATGDVDDLGNVAILPGLVNTHTHLEFSDLSEPLGEPGIGFVDWVRLVIEYRLGATDRRAVEQGLRESIRFGTTTLGEIAQPGWPVEQVQRAGLNTTVFLELIAPTADRVPPQLELARDHLAAADPKATWHPGLSPHAPYSVHCELLFALVSLSAAACVPLAFHLAETREELQLLRSGCGPLRDRLEELGAWDPQAIPHGTRPLDYLRSLAKAHRTLIVHGNYLDDDEIALLAANARKMAVVYCPRTHAFFRHDKYPLAKMLSAGVNVSLGTDSRASAADLSLLAEIRCVAQRHPDVDRQVVLQLGTLRAAAVLGRDHEVGSLEPGKLADLAVVALPDRDAADPYELLFDCTLPVVQTWRRGEKVSD